MLSVYFPFWSQKEVTADTKFCTLFAHHLVMSKHVGSPSQHHMHPSILQLISWIMLHVGICTFSVHFLVNISRLSLQVIGLEIETFFTHQTTGYCLFQWSMINEWLIDASFLENKDLY